MSVGLTIAGRFKAAELVYYILAQVAGGAAGADIPYLIASGQSGFAIDTSAAGAFANNGYGAFSLGGYSLAGAPDRHCLSATLR